jgi:ribose transport system substrate-binding protein
MNRTPRLLAAGAALALCVLSLAACNTESSDNDAKGSSSKTLKIGLANQQMSVTFPAAIAKGAKDEAEKLGVDLVVLDSQGDQAKQASQVQDLVGQKVDGIILVPLSPGPAQAMVDQADAAGIAVGTAHGYVGADRDVSDPYEKLKFIIDENEKGAGATAGQMALDAVPGGGEVAVITGAAGFVENKTRVEDFQKALDEKGGFKVVANQPGEWTKEGGQSACQNILAAHPKVSLFYAISDDMAVGCAAATKAAGSSAKIIGVGGSQGGIDAIKAGTVYGTVCYKPYTEGQMAVRAMVDSLNGKLTGPPETTFYDTPGVTKDNVDSCDPQW